MPLIPQEPTRPFDTIRREMERFFDPANWSFFQSQVLQTDVYETDTEVVVECAIPGVKKKEDIRIHLDGQQLTIQAVIQRHHTVEHENRRFHREERYYGQFQRTITLPHPVEEEGIKASYRNGILEVRMKKSAPVAKNRIDIDFH
ncbi:MAG: hypothetical protein BAA01_08575 [Bacillus thermozeamaize]|jgi:HSP20 family protein|uniref:SHSP domain-containing protein n=1 Tax=Bacillus thermozeamaize TaxID=230954 RepID=A0A1Y3PLI3_9BACI|nr:MAG: hypothetical protein BAA01_08575 [Bacillus thermozeamaize]